MTGDSNCTLYVGNLDCSVTEELIRVLFSQLGEVVSCKMFHETNSDPYCFVEFKEHSKAFNAISMMNDKMLNNRKMRVDWATGQGNKNKANKVDTTKHFHVYVGELSPEIDEQALREAFQVFGEISDCKVVKDPQTYKSRGYGFVVFVKKYEADVAITTMNGQLLGRKMIKARWATRKLPSSTPESKPEPAALDYDEVFNQTTGTNTTVFVGGLKQDITEDALQQAFHSYGPIDKIKIFKEKGYAFIKYTCKDHACQAIVAQHNSNLNGQTIRCSWGKDTGPEGQPPTATSPPAMDHPSVVATPIPAAVVAGQPVALNPAAVAAAYANAAGVPLGVPQMTAAVAGSPYAVASAGPQQVIAGYHPAMAVATPATTSAASSGQVVGYWQYYPQQMTSAAVAQQQQQQMMAFAAAHTTSVPTASPSVAYPAGHTVAASPSMYLPQAYCSPTMSPHAGAAPVSPVHYQPPMISPGSPTPNSPSAAPASGYMYMYHPSWASSGHPV